MFSLSLFFLTFLISFPFRRFRNSGSRAEEQPAGNDKREEKEAAEISTGLPLSPLLRQRETKSSLFLFPEGALRYDEETDSGSRIKGNTRRRAVIQERIRTVRERMTRACLRSGRRPEEVRLLMAVKTVSPERIGKALDAGERLIAENRVQEFREKYAFLKERNPEFHFIGHLQRNKVSRIIPYISCLQSLDSLKLAEKIQDCLSALEEEPGSGRPAQGRALDVLIQINTSGEESQFGLAPEDLLPFLKALSAYPLLRPRGLMTIGLLSPDEERVRSCFRTLRTLRDKVRKAEPFRQDFSELSMGMSGDLETAIEEGATLIRVGSAIFGERS